MLNDRRDLQPSALLRLMEAKLEEHLLAIEMDNPRLIGRDLTSWMYLSLTAQAESSVEPGEMLSMRTWFSGRRGPIFRREIEFRHSDGSPAIAACCFSALIDLKARRIVRDLDYLNRFSLPAHEPLLEAQSRLSVNAADYREAGRRRVLPSWLDGLRHVNNARYGDMIYDLLSGEETSPRKKLKRMEIYFLEELRCGEEVVLLRQDLPGCCSVLGVRGEGGSPAFSSRIYME
jgi:acyl-ACP thioesterase